MSKEVFRDLRCFFDLDQVERLFLAGSPDKKGKSIAS